MAGDDGLGGFFSNFWLDSEPSAAPPSAPSDASSSAIPLEESPDYNFFASPDSSGGGGLSQQSLIDASYSLIETGSTGMGPEVDKAMASSSKLQATSLAAPGDISALLNTIKNEKIPAVQLEMQKQLKAASEDAELTPAQAIAAAILQVAPIIIGGAMAGKSGAAIGAKAGGIGGVGLIKGIEEKAERGRERAKAEAAVKQQELKDLTSQAFNLTRDVAKEKFTAEQNKERNISREEAAREGRPPPLVSDTTINKLAISNGVLEEIDKTLEFIDANFKINESWLDVGVRKVSELAPDSPARDLLSQLESITLRYGEALSTGAPSNKDLERVNNAIKSGDWAAIQSSVRSLSRARQLQASNINSLIKANKQAGRDTSGLEGAPTARSFSHKEANQLRSKINEYGKNNQTAEATAFIRSLIDSGYSQQEITEILKGG